jgi:hypothetical protein
VEHVVDGIQSYQKHWLQHVKRMEHARIPRIALEYKPQCKRDIGRPRTRWRGQQHIQDWILTGQDLESCICLPSRWWWWWWWLFLCIVWIYRKDWRLLSTCKWKEPLGRSRHRCKNNIIMAHKEGAEMRLIWLT